MSKNNINDCMQIYFSQKNREKNLAVKNEGVGIKR